jgi:hypothetical protein
MDLTDSDRADIARIVINSKAGIHETLAKHFIAVGQSVRPCAANNLPT